MEIFEITPIKLGGIPTDIKNKTVLVLGGWGLVGSAICRNLVEEGPKRIIVASLLKSEAMDAVGSLEKLFPKLGSKYFVPWWGNIFLRHELKDRPRKDLLGDSHMRQKLIDDLLDELTTPVLQRSALYQLLKKQAPDIVIDCINSGRTYSPKSVQPQLLHLPARARRHRPLPRDPELEVAIRAVGTLLRPASSRLVHACHQL